MAQILYRDQLLISWRASDLFAQSPSSRTSYSASSSFLPSSSLLATHIRHTLEF